MYWKNRSFYHTGDLSVESSVYEWLTDEDNRELQGYIEGVNNPMLNKLISNSLFVATLFISKGGLLKMWYSI